MRKILIYDTTLRDGTQGEGITFSLEDKLRIAKRLDKLGVDYIEGGWPGANPKDLKFFQRVKSMQFEAKLVAFGSTRQHKYTVVNDPNLRALLEAETPVIAIYGKSWDFQVREVLRITLEQNLSLITDSIAHLKRHLKEVIFDAEHFFDGYKANPEYAIKSLLAAIQGGADCLVLCDTNGGTLPLELMEIVSKVRQKVDAPSLGIHAHNDSGTAVASSLMAIQSGAVQVQGTINGYGERCGNADLCLIIPAIKLKLGLDCVSDEQLMDLTELSLFISETANLRHNKQQPYVGESAFAHKGGMHADAIGKNCRAYEHIDPKLVGNTQRVLISELSGRANILSKSKELKIPLGKDHPALKPLLVELKQLEYEGYQFEGAEGSFELLLRKAMGQIETFFKVLSYKVTTGHRFGDKRCVSEAVIKLKVDGSVEHVVADGNGPVSALDKALRQALEKHYPCLKKMELADFKVRILNGHGGAGSKTRVLIESKDHEETWGTVGVSTDMIEASWEALVDSINLKLLKDKLTATK